jgi:hypothetical protein
VRDGRVSVQRSSSSFFHISLRFACSVTLLFGHTTLTFERLS